MDAPEPAAASRKSAQSAAEPAEDARLAKRAKRKLVVEAPLETMEDVLRTRVRLAALGEALELAPSTCARLVAVLGEASRQSVNDGKGGTFRIWYAAKQVEAAVTYHGSIHMPATPAISTRDMMLDATRGRIAVTLPVFRRIQFDEVNAAVTPDLDGDAWHAALDRLVRVLSRDVGQASHRESALENRARALEERLRAEEEARRALHEDLEQHRIIGEAAAAAHNEFLANMSHEIRTPLNAVLGMAALIADTDLGAEQRRFVEVIQDAGTHLLTLISDILDLAKIDSGYIDFVEAPAAVRVLASDALELVAPMAGDKDLELELRIEPGTPDVATMDAGRLRQVLVNLLGNAVKFTPDGLVVLEVGLESPPSGDGVGHFYFEVQDTGPGVPRHMRERIFEAFRQGETGATRSHGGTGLGLTISQRLVERMGGAIRVGSRKGGGASFRVSLPLPVADEVDPVLQEDAKIRGLSIAYIDANPARQESVGSLLNRWGAKAVRLDSAEHLVRLVDDANLDCIVVHHAPPHIDAADVADRLEAAGHARPFVALSSFRDSAKLRQRFEGRGVVVDRPWRAESLLQSLQVVTTGRDAPAPGSSTLDETMAKRHPLDILVVEDNPVNQLVTLTTLRRLGYQPDLCHNGLEAFQAVRDRPYDLVLMDVQMPVLDGLAATRRIVRHVFPRPRIVGLTAHAGDAAKRECLDSGMDMYISKPVSIEDLVREIEATVPLAAA